MRQLALVALGLALALSGAAGAAAPVHELLGYEEGSRRTVRCKGGGHFTGLEVGFNSFYGFTEQVVVAIRLRCSTGSLDLQYTGIVPDGKEFGAGMGSAKVLTAACPPGKGIAALQWRRGEISGKDDQAWKPAGIQVYCGSETMNPITLDLSSGKQYDKGEVQCSRTATPPAATVERAATEVEVWQENDWAGLRIRKCEGLKTAA